MEWQFTGQGRLAYKIKGNQILITGQVSHNPDGSYWVMVDEDDDFYVNTLTVNPDNTISMEDWIDLRQFNNSNSLGDQILLINQLVSKINGTPVEVLDLTAVLQEKPIFKTSKVSSNDTFDLTATLSIGKQNYSLEKQFIKYTFIDSKICARPWTVKDLYNFFIHVQVFLYTQEKESGSDNFLDVDREVETILSK